MLQTWAPSSQTVAFDLSSVINFNGLSPQMAYKPITSSQPVLQPHPSHRMPFPPNGRTQRSNSSKNFTRPPATLPLVNQVSEAADSSNMGNGSADVKSATRPLLASAGVTTPASSPAPFSPNRQFPDSPADAQLMGRKRNEFVPMRGASDPVVAAAAPVLSTNGPNSGAHTNRTAKPKIRNKRRDMDSMSASSGTSETRPKVQVKAPSFDLEAAAFPPLPGATAQPPPPLTSVPNPPADRTEESNGCLADVVKGLSRSWKDSCSISDVTDGRDPTTSQSVGVTADAQPVLEPVLKPAVPAYDEAERDVSANPSDSEADADAVSPVCGCSSASKTLSYCDVARKAKQQQPKPDACCNSVPAATCSNVGATTATTTANSEYPVCEGRD